VTPYFGLCQGKRRTVHHRLVVFESDKQLRRALCDRRDMIGIAPAHFARQRNQSSAVKHRVNRPKDLWRQIEDITDKDINPLRGNALSSGHEQGYFAGLATKRLDYPGPRRNRQGLKVRRQHPVHLAFVKSDLCILPPGVPEIRFHALPLPLLLHPRFDDSRLMVVVKGVGRQS
jgi:hypothetical protein